MNNKYIGPYGKFKYENTPIEWFEELHDGILQIYERETTYVRKKWNQRILNKWEGVYHEFLKMAGSVRESELDGPVTWYHNQCLPSIVLFGLSYVITDNGFPMFVAPWQYEFMKDVEIYEDIAGLMSRKLGKTELLKMAVLKKMIKPKNIGAIEHVRMFAPKERQLFLRDRINRMLRRSRFFQEEFIMEKNTDKYKRGRFSDTNLEFGRNGSTMIGAGLAQSASGGRSATGEAGTFFVLDEFGQVEQKAIDIAITPMLIDAYSDKKLARLGTPTLDINPDMKSYWKRLQTDPQVKDFSYDWVYGVQTGCIPKKAMMKIAHEKNIPCPFMLAHGICGKEMLTDARMNEMTNKITYPWEEGYDKCWKCNDVCLIDGSFVEEYCADFGQPSESFWDMDMIRATGNPALRWIDRPEKEYKPEYFLSVDFGHLTYPTQAILAENKDGKMIKRKVLEILPKSETRAQSDNKKYAQPILKRLHDEFDVFEPYIKEYYFDITGDRYGYLSYDIVNGFDDVRGFPRNKIHRNQTTLDMKKNKNVELWGIWVSGEWNSERKKDLRTAFYMNMVESPMLEPFWTDYLWEFENCKPALTANEQYWTFKEPKNGKKRIDMLDAESYLTLGMDFNRKGKRPPVMAAGVFKRQPPKSKYTSKYHYGAVF